MKIAFYINDSKPGAKAAAEKLSSRAASLGLEVADLCPSSLIPHPTSFILVALGGDGTILRCVHERPGVPVLGFNLGGLGYLSSVEKKDFDQALALLAGGRYRIAERTMLSLSLRAEGRTSGSVAAPQALNDIVITREMTGHAAMIDLSVDGHRATRYLADGLVIATPTGSTAYSLSAGGPVVMPDARSFVITPMNPHALGIRPQVVADSSRLVINAISRDSACASRRGVATAPGTAALGVYADGEPVAMLSAGESVEISKSKQVAKFVELEGYDPYAVLAHKLGWAGTTL